MNYDEMLHCIRAVAEATGEDEIRVFGSQAPLLALGELPEDAAQSNEADIMTVFEPVTHSYDIDGAFNEDSQFYETFELVIDGVLESELVLADDWEERAETFDYDVGGRTIHITTPSVDDIAAGKLAAGREKDRIWLQAMYNEGLLDAQEIFSLIWRLNISFEEAQGCESRLNLILNEISTRWQR